ncbi:MAG: enoyl-CoA hydratase [Crocinitomicaceae bacterium]|nr:enoyl-CoA hydratase [Crocinitomicaceae bacterium]|tara:strand:- start:3958 stop:4743 length:786 start_codon:yes stop_codon:yes gene_type:complete
MKDYVIKTLNKGIAELCLNRPERYNAFDQPRIEALADLLTKLAKDPNVKVIIIRGSGKAFCAGGDLEWVKNHPDGYSSAFHSMAMKYHQAVLEIKNMSKPVIAAINGVAAGGGFSLAMACDFRIMAQNTSLKQGYTSAGLSIDGGGSFTLPRLVGMAKALEIMAFDVPISSKQALDWGLVTKVVEDNKVLPEAREMAGVLMARSSSSFKLSKRLFNKTFNSSFEEQIEEERRFLAESANHRDAIEGLAAFVEKRKPSFSEV